MAEPTQPTNLIAPPLTPPTTPAPVPPAVVTPPPAEQDPRKTPAFLAVTQQLEDVRTELAQVKQAEATKTEDAERTTLKANEDWTALEERYKQDAEKKEAAHLVVIAEFETKFERERNKSALALIGVRDSEHAEFLIDAYLRADPKPESFDAWVPVAKEHDSYKHFFGVVVPGAPVLPPPPGGPAAVRSSGVFTKADLSDPARAKEASAYATQFYKDNGVMPW